MDLYPAIDLLGGRCVRLRQGRLDDVTVYDDDPVARASAFESAGSRWLHVVDLDRALDTGHDNVETVKALCDATGLAVQVGGGLRSADACEAMLDSGATRIVLGTAAIEDPDLVTHLSGRHPGRIAAAVDALDGEVAVRGWQEGGGIRAETLARRLEESGVAAILATEVSRDGMLTGPDVDGLVRLLVAVGVPVLASGGVRETSDLVVLAGLERGGRRLAGAVVGKAIYEGHVDVGEAIVALREADTRGGSGAE